MHKVKTEQQRPPILNISARSIEKLSGDILGFVA
jgi:hypothetical protein